MCGGGGFLETLVTGRSSLIFDTANFALELQLQVFLELAFIFFLPLSLFAVSGRLLDLVLSHVFSECLAREGDFLQFCAQF